MDLVKNWAYTIESRNPKDMVAFYDSNAVLLATYSNMLKGSSEILEYFNEFLDNEYMKCEVNYTTYKSFGIMDAYSGLYTFYVKPTMDDDMVMVKARFTFVVYDGLIVQHHSSVLPE